MSTCKLCDSKTELCDSHVIPEFFYKPAYDEIHRGSVLQLQPNKKFFIQKGYREKLLCKDCEGTFSKYEDYLARKWYQEKVIPRYIDDKIVTIENLDYRTFKLFHLSILFRASVSTRTEFEHIDLGPHEKRIKKLILNNDPGSKYQYTFFGIVQTHKGKLLDGIIMQPLPSKLDAHRVYIFLFGGVQWHYIVSSHKPYDYIALLYTGEDLILAPEEFTDNNFIRDFAKEFNKSI